MEINQFGSSHLAQDEPSSLHSDFGPSMTDNQTQKQQKQPLISFKYHPGFFCFFENYTNQQDWTFYECYEKVFQSHHEMMKIRRPIDSILNDKQTDKIQKITELMHRAQKDKKFAYYLQRPEGQLQCNVIVHEDKRIEQINKLKQELNRLERTKAKVIQNKKKEFQLKQIQKCKEQELQLEGILNEKERRANLIRKIQIEAQQQRAQRLQQKKRQEYSQPKTNSWTGCEIM